MRGKYMVFAISCLLNLVISCSAKPKKGKKTSSAEETEEKASPADTPDSEKDSEQNDKEKDQVEKASEPEGLEDPTNFTYEILVGLDIKLNWRGVEDGYRIVYQEGAQAPKDCQSGLIYDIAPIEFETVIIKNLSADTSYSFRVCAMTLEAPFNFSVGKVLENVSTPSPTEVTNLTLKTADETSISFQWTPPSGSFDFFSIAYLEGAIAPDDCTEGTSFGKDTAEHTISDLSAGTLYSFRLCTGNNLLDSPESEGVTIIESTGADIAFTTEWKTDNAGGSTNNDQIHLPLVEGGYYNFTVNWGDGSSEETIAAWDATEATHTFLGGAGTYTVTITGKFDRFGFPWTGSDADKLIDVTQWGNQVWATMEKSFYGAANLVVSAADTPNLSRVTSMESMFNACTGFNSDISSWDTSNVTNMQELFMAASSFNQNISTWNTANVTNMQSMFRGASSFNQPVGAWNTSNVMDMSKMFGAAASFDQNIGSWDISQVNDLNGMFNFATSFNQNIGTWNTAQVTNMSEMFADAYLFDQDISGWNTSNVTSMKAMFNDARLFNQNISSWDTSKVTDMSSMFKDTDDFDQPIGSWSTSSVTDMSNMFEKAASFNQDLDSWDTSKVTDMSYMLSRASSFSQSLNSWDTSLVTDMSFMFYFNTAFNGNVASWNTSETTTMDSMFALAVLFNQDIGVWNTAKVTNMESMFQNASAFDRDISGWNTDEVTDYTDFDSSTNPGWTALEKPSFSP